MAWEWASPVSGALIGLAGLAAGWRISVGGRNHDEQMARLRHEHEADLVAAQWRRDRQADAYLELLEMAEAMGQWVDAVFPMMDTNPPRPLPEPPDRSQQAHAWARLAAFGTREVKDRADTWREVALSAVQTAEAIARKDEGAREALHHIRSRERLARGLLAAEISDELISG